MPKRRFTAYKRPQKSDTGLIRLETFITNGSMKIAPRLVEKAALGLVIWNLARRGIDCVETTTDSSNGDIWARTPDGKAYRVEVKGGSSPTWNIRREQIDRADIFVFVAINSGRAWLMDRRTLIASLTSFYVRGEGFYTLTQAKMPAGTADAWSAFDGAAERVSKSAVYKSERVVRRKLASGVLKEYRYPAGGGRPVVRLL